MSKTASVNGWEPLADLTPISPELPSTALSVYMGDDGKFLAVGTDGVTYELVKRVKLVWRAVGSHR